jgi:molybdopterin converting factor small subunit
LARVVLTNWLSQRFTGGESEIEVSAGTVRQMIAELDGRFPGIGAELKSGMAVAIDGEIFTDPFLEPIRADSEVYFLPPLEGG